MHDRWRVFVSVARVAVKVDLEDEKSMDGAGKPEGREDFNLNFLKLFYFR